MLRSPLASVAPPASPFPLHWHRLPSSLPPPSLAPPSRRRRAPAARSLDPPLGPLLASGSPLAHSRQLRRGGGAKLPAGLQVGRARRADHADRRAGAAPVEAGGDGLDGPDRAAGVAGAVHVHCVW